MTLQAIERLLGEHRYETVRRHCLDLLSTGEQEQSLLRLLYQAYRGLGDLRTAMQALDELKPASDDERFENALRKATDWQQLAAERYYRESDEARQGLSVDEYHQKMQAAAVEQLQIAEPLAQSDAQRKRLSDASHRNGDPAGIKVQASPSFPRRNEETTGACAGALHFADGSPVANATVTLGLKVDVYAPDPATYLAVNFGDTPHIGPQDVLTTSTDSQGRFRFDVVPTGEHAFLAVSLDPQRFDITTRFVTQGITIRAGQTTTLDCTVTDWISAPPRPFETHWPNELEQNDVRYRQIHQESIRNPFYFEFPRQLISFPLPAGADIDRLLLVGSDEPTKSIEFQLCDNRVTFFVSLGPIAEKSFALYEAIHAVAPAQHKDFRPFEERNALVIDTGRAQFRIAGEQSPIDAPPLMAVRGEDGIWRGQGRIHLPAGVRMASRKTTILETGPLATVVQIAYQLSTGDEYAITFIAHQGEAYLLARETSPPIDGAAFEFSLKEFSGGRGFLHWTPEHGHIHWRDLTAEDREIARLQESVAWWVPPCGFGYAMTAGGLTSKDYIGVFTIHRGDWIDRKFERIAQGPGDDHRELDWPFPEMVGSTISMITAQTDADGDVFFRFGFFDGERQWGVLVSTLDRNDGPYKEISAVQHKVSAPRLDAFKEWRLDEQDHVERPFVVARRSDLKLLRAKKTSPLFEPTWKRICEPKASGAAAGLRFAVDGDPSIAWRKKLELIGVAKARSRMTLLGRDYSDMYSPVGARPITPWVEEYDLIAASGVFTPDEERLVRQFFMLMGHLYIEPDFMNWKFNSRNANFEADRTDVVGAIGLAFHGNPDADGFVTHAAELMEKSINIYCTPGSGKWYENPSCYYLHASKCRMNLAFHLASHDIMDPTRIGRLKDFLRWGVLLLTPPCPHSYDVMRDGTGDDAGYRSAEKVRRISPIGDHANLGPWVPDHYPLLAKLYRKTDPAFADLLLWAWQIGGGNGAYFGNAPLLFSALSEEDLQPAPPQTLASRRLEGFGASFRGQFNQSDELFLLLKQGPGGYRYHRTEGSIILFANGKPLIYDGGEAGETWRHSTLSFYDSHMPLAAGHVERFRSLPAIDFCQGVHPVALKPGDPVFLSDRCEHDLVEVAHQRFNEPDPADSRSVFWVKDQYLILHDELNLDTTIPSHWHLQVVADAHTRSADDGYLFHGRFGTNLQVLLPGQSFASESVEQVPILDYHRSAETSFPMRHLQLTGAAPSGYLAVLRPISAGQPMLAARAIISDDQIRGVHVTGGDVDDRLFFTRNGVTLGDESYDFTGRYGAVLRRKDHHDLILLDGQHLRSGDIVITSDGPSAQLRVTPYGSKLTVEGEGRVTVNLAGRASHFESHVGQSSFDLPI